MSMLSKCTNSHSSILPACALAIAAIVLVVVPTRANAGDPAWIADQANHSKMDGMSMTGDADYDFAANMRTHHQVAVDMSQAEIKNGKNPQMLQLAKDIIAAQMKEISLLDQWLQAHPKAAPPAVPKSK